MEKAKTSRTRVLVYIALFAVCIAICAWISVPTTVPFTLQTFGIFLALGLLGGKRGTAAIALYILLGAVGIPVFAGFKAGIGALLGTTGGYILGFLMSGLVYWLVTSLAGNRTWAVALGMVLGLLVCYAFGTAWFMTVYARTKGAVSLSAALGWCVLPFLLPDGLKIALALLLSKKLAPHMGI